MPVYEVTGVVQFTGAGSLEIPGVYVGVPMNPQLSTTTDASGAFTISALAGTQTITFTKEGYTFSPTADVVVAATTLESYGIPTGWRVIDSGFETELKVLGYDDDESPYHYFTGGVGGTLLQLTYDEGTGTYDDSPFAWFSPSGKTIVGVAPADRDRGIVWLYDASGGIYTYEAGADYTNAPSDPADWDLNFQMGASNILSLDTANAYTYVLTGESTGDLFVSSNNVAFTPISSPSGSSNLTYLLADYDDDDSEYSVVVGDNGGNVWIYTGAGYNPTTWTQIEVNASETINSVTIDGDIGYLIALCNSGAVYRAGDGMDTTTWSLMFDTPYVLNAMDALGADPGLTSAMIVGSNGLILVNDSASQ